MQHTVTEHFTKYYPERLTYASIAPSSQMSRGFILKIRIDSSAACGKRKQLLSVPGMLKIYAGTHHFPEAFEALSEYEKRECYHVYADENGDSPYVEAVIRLYRSEDDAEGREMSLGLPLNLYPAFREPVYLLFDGVRFAWIAGGEIVNRNFPVGFLKMPAEEMSLSDGIKAEICYDMNQLQSEEQTEIKKESIAFYSARGYSAWAGDIVNFYHDGVYHFLVLYDRYHHGSRFGGGAHSTYHMTTRDFIHWENYGEIYPLRHQWESFGTGTMFFFDGKYYYIHGFHTDRIIPTEQTGSPLMEERYRKDGVFHAVTYEELETYGRYPSGANYLVSEDGIHFVQGKKQIHCAENPSVYVDENGGLVMYAGYGAAGVWQAPAVDGPWKMADRKIPGGNSSPVGNSTECPSIFAWNGYKYIIMGFRGYWQSGLHNEEYIDLAAVGEDIYDGLGVPMVANCDGRYILSGWVGGYGWAFVTQHRELVQHENGRLGIRWLPELTPNPAKLRKAAVMECVPAGSIFQLDRKTSYYLECRVKPQENGRIGIAFSGAGKPCVFECNTPRQKVQMCESDRNDDFTGEVKALCEYIPEMPKDCTSVAQTAGQNVHTNSHDFAIVKVRELSAEYSLKLILHYEKKSDSLIVDAEIGGGRTFISNRMYFTASTIRILCEHAEIMDLKLCVMGEEA